jgi:hypothetical protein
LWLRKTGAAAVINNTKIKLKCLLEGIEVDVVGVTVSTSINTPAMAEIVFPPVAEVSGIMRKTSVVIFFYDYLSSCYRVLFTGMVTTPSYAKGGSTQNRRVYAISDIAILNDLPSKYMDAILNNTEVGRSDYAFYNIPMEDYVDYRVNSYVSAIYTPEKMYNKGIIGFVNHYLNITLGDKAFDNYYKNLDKIHNIKESFTLVDNGQMETIYPRVIIINRLNNTIAKLTTRGKILDTLLESVKEWKYIYTTLCSPPYSGETRSIDNDSVKIEKHPNASLSYIVMPEMLNIAPPICNVIYIDQAVDISIKIYDNMVTRLLNKYKMAANTISYGIYPVTLSKSAKEGNPPLSDITENDFNMTVEELETGMIPMEQDKSYLFASLLKPVVEPEEPDNTQEYLNKDTRYDYYAIKYGSNGISLTLNGFDPHIVCGLSAMVCDVETETVYYGFIVAKTINIDMQSGRVSVSVNMTNVREIKDVREIFASRNSENNWVADKGMPFLPPTKAFNINADGSIPRDGNGRSYQTTEVYEPILKGTPEKKINGNSIVNNQGWMSVLDIKNGENKDKGIIEELFKRYKTNDNVHGWREIMTEAEYYYSKISNVPCGEDSKYGADLSALKDTAKAIDMKNLAGDTVNDKALYITERQEKAKALQTAIVKRVL